MSLPACTNYAKVARVSNALIRPRTSPPRLDFHLELSEEMAKILALQLAARQNTSRLLCSTIATAAISTDSTSLPLSGQSTAASFLSSILSSNPFHLFFASTAAAKAASDKQQQQLPSSTTMWNRTLNLFSSNASSSEDAEYHSNTASAFETPVSTPPISRSVSRLSLNDCCYSDLPQFIGFSHVQQSLLDLKLAVDRTSAFELILRTLKFVFSHSDNLNQSFTVTSSSSLSDTSSVCGVFVGVDLKAVRETFQLLFTSLADTLTQEELKQLKDSVSSALEVLLAKLLLSSKKWKISSLASRSEPRLRDKLFQNNKTRSDSNSSLNALLSNAAAPPVQSSQDVLLQLRQLVIILESPFVCDADCYLGITRKLAVVIAKLHKSVKKHFMIHLALAYSQDSNGFERLVSLFRTVVCERYRVSLGNLAPTLAAGGNRQSPNSKEQLEDDGVVASVRVLSFLYNVNEYSGKLSSLQVAKTGALSTELQTCAVVDGAPLRTIVPFWVFYCTTNPGDSVFVSPAARPSLQSTSSALQNLPLKSMYFSFIRVRSDPRLLSSSFSLLNYPFLLDPIFKTRIVRIENLSWMSSEFEEAFVRQGFMGSLKRIIEGVQSLAVAPVDAAADHGTLSALEEMESTYSTVTVPYCVLEVRRSHLIQDSQSQISKKWIDLHKPLKIKFLGEEGLDQGGVQKEFFQLILADLLDESNHVFTCNPETKLCWFDTFNPKREPLFRLVGVVLGLAVYNGVMVDINLPLAFYKKLLYEHTEYDSEEQFKSAADGIFTLDDLAQLDPMTYRGLALLLSWDSVNGTVEDVFCRNFEISLQREDGTVATIELIRDGSQIVVTESNRELYVELYVNYLLIESVKAAFGPLSDGFWRVVGGPAFLQASLERESKSPSVASSPVVPCSLELFRPEELRVLMTGLSTTSAADSIYSATSFAALKNSLKYEDFTADSRIIVWFWDVVLNEFSNEQRRKLMWFVTASDRLPLGGYSKLNVVIQRNGPDSDRLPTSSTCFARLLLPEYSTKQKLARLLSLAVEESTGFGLL